MIYYFKKYFSAVVVVTAGVLWIEFCPNCSETNQEKNRLRTYMLHGDHVDSGYLKHVQAVLQRLGYHRVDNSSDFDLLWSHVYPFGERAPFSKFFLQNLQPFQKVNHFPGSGYFTNKVDLAISGLKHIPLAFHLPAQKMNVLEYAKNNTNLMFVQKSNSHRGIRIRKVTEMDLDQDGTFVQEFVQNPLLIDGYKFDIGIYTILTSVDPLRVYIYNGDALLRFCPKKYHPFDPNDVDKYVIADDYLPTWQVPSLKKIYNDLQFNMKESLNFYLKNQKKDATKIWKQIEESIVSVFLAKEEKILSVLRHYKNVGNFFEMARFDFIVDEDLNVYLMEANMSPNLSSDHFPPNKVLYENVLFNLFGMVGVGRRTYLKGSISSSADESTMEVNERSLMVFPEKCASIECATCSAIHCSLCQHCLTDNTVRILRDSYLEHVNKLENKRIFPYPLEKVDESQIENLSPENRMMQLWFTGKCQLDKSWC